MPSVPARRKAVDRPAPPEPPAGVSMVAATATLGWDCRCAIVEGRPSEPFLHRSPEHVVAFHLAGAARVELTRGGKFTRFCSEPGSFTALPAGVDYVVRIDRPVKVLCWSIAPGRSMT